MKIALPVNSNDLDRAEIENKFAQANGFIIYDTDSKKDTFIPNPVENKDELSGVGLLIVQALLAEEIEAVAVNMIGKKSLEQLSSKGVEVYKTAGNLRAREVLEQIKKGELREYEEE